MTVEIRQGDARSLLATLPAQSVHCAITSPPYWNLRDYQAGRQEIGREDTPQGYVAALVDVFRGVHRVLRDDGTLWVVLGDSYAHTGGREHAHRDSSTGFAGGHGRGTQGWAKASGGLHKPRTVGGAQRAKSLLGMPWRVAFALQGDGWILRSAITWCKDNPMPESVQDRPTSATEMIFMLAKKPTYYYDALAIAEPSVSDHGSGNGYKRGHRLTYDGRGQDESRTMAANPTRNKRNWWRVSGEPLDEPHYAAFPQALVVPMVLAGTSEAGCCPACGAPYRRVVERTPARPGVTGGISYGGATAADTDVAGARQRLKMRGGGFGGGSAHDAGWQAGCSCDAGPPIGCTTLDPFLGSGTVALVSKRLGRSCVGIELNEAYAEMARRRVESVPYTLFGGAASTEGAAR